MVRSELGWGRIKDLGVVPPTRAEARSLARCLIFFVTDEEPWPCRSCAAAAAAWDDEDEPEKSTGAPKIRTTGSSKYNAGDDDGEVAAVPV